MKKEKILDFLKMTFGTILMERAWDLLSVFLLLLFAVLAGREKLAGFMREQVLQPFAERFSMSIWLALGLAAAAFAT